MRDTPPDLAVLALRYAAGDLPPDETTAFEERLGDDQPAREALAEAIRLSASAVGQPVPTPSAGVRAGVRDRLFPTWLSRLFPRKSYRGHPVTWAGLGGTVAAGVAALAFIFSNDPTPPIAHPTHLRRELPPPAIEALDLSPIEEVQAAVPPVEVAPMPLPGVPGPRAARPTNPLPMPMPTGDRGNG